MIYILDVWTGLYMQLVDLWIFWIAELGLRDEPIAEGRQPLQEAHETDPIRVAICSRPRTLAIEVSF